MNIPYHPGQAFGGFAPSRYCLTGSSQPLKKSVRKSGQSRSTIAFVMNGTRLFIDRIPWRPELINTHFEVSSSSASQINKKTVTPKHLVHRDISYTLTFGTSRHLVHPDIWYTLTFGTPWHLVHPDNLYCSVYCKSVYWPDNDISLPLRWRSIIRKRWRST